MYEEEKVLTPRQQQYIKDRQRHLPVVREEKLPNGAVLKCVCERCGAYYLGRGIEVVGSERVTLERYSGGTIPQEIEGPDGTHHTIVFRCNCEVGRIYWRHLQPYDAQPGTTKDDTEADATQAMLKRRWRALILHKHPDWTVTEVEAYIAREETRIRSRGKTLVGLTAAVRERADIDGPF